MTDATFRNVSFASNTATYGGAVFLNTASLISTGSSWTNNAATSGGAIYLVVSTATVTNNSMSGNSAYDTYNYNYGSPDSDTWGTSSFSCTATGCN